MKRFSELTKEELVDIEGDVLGDAIRVEAIERGIKIPIKMSEAVSKVAYQGTATSEGDMVVYQLDTEGYYEEVGWLTEEDAIRAMQGVVCIGSTYKNGRNGKKIDHEKVVVVKRIQFPGEPELYKIAQITEWLDEDRTAYDELLDECVSQVRAVRQQDYDDKVARERKAEYLRLADGDEEIAKRFWTKAETLSWPED